MMKVMWGILIALAVTFTAAAGDGDVAQPEGKSADYYRILLKNPRPGYLFERFCNSWLEYHDLKELETFLESEKDKGAGNQLLLALYHGRAGNNEKALKLCSEALQSDPDNARILFYRAQLHESLGQLSEAAEDLDLVVESGGKLRPDALKELGRVYIRQGLVAAGVQSLETLLKEEDNDSSLQEEVIELKVDEGLYDEALVDCDKMIKSSKNAQTKVMLSLRKSSILLRLDRRKEALETLDKSLESVAAGSWLEKEILSRISRAFRTQDDLSGLADHYDALLEAHPNNLALLHNQINVMLERSDSDAALKHVRTLVKLAPMDESVREFYVEVLRECDQYEEAIKIVSGMLERNPGNNELRIRLAGLYYHNDQVDDIRPIMIEYLERSPKKEYDYFRAARLMARFGDQNDATQIYLDCLDAYPDSLETREALAYHLVRRGMFPMAQTHIDLIQQKGEEGDLVRISGFLCGAGRAGQAVAFLNGRLDDFGNSARFLEAVYQARLAVPVEDRPEGGLELTMRWLRASDSIEGLRRAAYAVQNEVRQQDSEEQVKKDLETKTDRTIPDIYLLSHIYFREAEPEKAWGLIEEELRSDPSNVLLLRIRLEQARKQDNLERSIDSLNRLAEASPDKRLAWIREHVDVLLNAEDYKGALAKLEQWKAISRDNPQVYLRETKIFLAQGEMEEAISRLRRAAFRLRDFSELQERLAGLYMQEGRIAEAEQVHWTLVDAEEDLQQKLVRFSKLVESVRWTDRMEAITDQMSARSEANKQSVFPLLALAECHRISWNHEARRKVLLQVLELKSDDTAIMRSVAMAEAEAGNHARSLALLRQVARLEKNERALLDLAQAQFRFGNLEKGLEILRQECSLDNADELVKIACAMISSGASEQLADLLVVRLGEFPDDYRISFLYAVALEEISELDGAAEIFLRLLAIEKERPGLSPHRKPTALQASWFPAEDLPTISQFIQIMENEHQVYAYRNNRGSRSSGAGIEPQTVEQLMTYTIVHLKELLPQLDESAGETIRLAMEQAEVPYVDMVLADSESIFFDTESWAELMKKYPDDPELAYFAALIGVFLREEGVTYSEEQCKTIFNLLVEDYPGGALFAVFCGMDQDEELVKELPELLKRCARKKNSLPMLSEVFGELGEDLLSMDMSGEIKAAFRDYALSLPDQYLDDRIMILMRIRDFDALAKEISMMNETAARTTARNRYRGFSQSTRQGYIKPLSFPPEGILDSRLLQLSRDVDDEMIEAFKTIENPVVRLALLCQVLEEKELAAIVDEINESEIAGFEKNILLGSWYASQGDPDQALTYLISARHSAPSAAARKRIDGAMLDCALVIEELTDDQRRELKAAVLRLSATHVAQQDSSVLFELRKELGMREQKVTKVATRQYSSYSSPSSSQSTDDKVRKLLGDGKTDQALRETAILLRRSVPGMMTLSGQRNDRDLNECINLIKQHKLIDQFLETLKPEEGASPRKRLEYAMALDCTDRSDEARAEYEAILEEQSTWVGVRYRVAVKMVGQPEEAAELLSSLHTQQMMEVMNRLQNAVSGNTTAEERLHLVEMVIHLCPKLLESRQPVFAGSFLNMASRAWHGMKVDGNDSYMLPDLFDKKEKSEETDGTTYQLRYRKNEQMVQVQQRRKELYLELCELFIQNDTTAKEGFSGKERYYRFNEMDMEPIFELAEEILLRLGTETSKARGMSRVYYSSNNEQVGLEEYYALECRHRDMHDRYQQTLEAVKQPMLREQLELQHKFYFSTEQEFRELLSEQVRQSRRNSRQSFQPGALFRAYEACGYTFDLTPTLVEIIDPRRQDTLWAASSWMQTWINSCVESGRNEMAVSAMQAFVDKLFPPSDLAKLKPVDPGNNSYFMPNTIEGRVNLFETIFRELEADLPTWFGLVDAVAPVLYARESHYYSLSDIWDNKTNVTAKAVLQTPFVKDWGTFRAYAFGGDESMLDEYLNQSKADKELADVLRSVEPPTFGSRLLGYVVNAKESDPQTVAVQIMALCGEYQAQIEAADDTRRKDLFNQLSFFQEELGFELSDEQFTNKAAGAFAKYYQEHRSRANAAAAERLLGGKTVPQSDNIYEFNREAGLLVRQMARPEPETARQLLDRMVEVGNQAKRMGRTSRSSYSDPVNTLYNAVLDYGVPGEAAILMLLKYAYEYEHPGGWIELEETFSDHLAARRFNVHRKRFEAEGKEKLEGAQLAVRETFAELDNAVSAYGCPPVLAATSRLVQLSDDPDALAEWLGSEKAVHLKHRDIYRFIAQDKESALGADGMKAMVESGCELEKIRAVFAIRLYEECENQALSNPALVSAVLKAVQVLPPEQWLDESGSTALVKQVKGDDEETLELLYNQWCAAHRKFPEFGKQNSAVSVAIANLLIHAERLENAAHILSACNDSSLSSLVVWVKLRKKNQAGTCMNEIISNLRKKDRYMKPASIDWNIEDREWFTKVVNEWEGEDARFAEICVSTIPVDTADAGVDVASITAELKSKPFKTKNLEIALVDLLTPLADEGELDGVLASLYTEEKLIEYLKSGHDPGLSRLKAYVKVLVRTGNKEKMTELGKLHDTHNDKPGCVHEKELRDAVRKGEQDLGINNV